MAQVVGVAVVANVVGWYVGVGGSHVTRIEVLCESQGLSRDNARIQMR